MATGRQATTIDGPNYQRAGVFAAIGALLLAVHAVYAAATGSDIPVVLPIAPFFLSACVVSLAITVNAVRGRNLGIAMGMMGSVVGIGSGLLAATTDDPGPFLGASMVLAFVGILMVGLSFPKPRNGYPKYAVYAFLSGAAVLALRGAIGILDENFADLAYLAPAVAWAFLGRVCLGPDPLPRPVTAPTKARPVGQTKSRPGQARKSKKKR